MAYTILTDFSSVLFLVTFTVGLSVFLVLYSKTPLFRFIWYCFFRPIGDVDQKARLEKVVFATSC